MTGPAQPKDPRTSGRFAVESSAAAYAGLGLQFALAIVLFLFVGKWLDEKLGTSPWLLVAGVFLGATAGFYSIYRRLMADQRKEEEARRR
jgi:F0F1-type ATP synthase assembly protein I